MATDPAIPTTIPTTKAAAQALLDKLYAANPITLGDSEAISDAVAEVNVILTQLNQEDHRIAHWGDAGGRGGPEGSGEEAGGAEGSADAGGEPGEDAGGYREGY
jgi:hypothetical protein